MTSRMKTTYSRIYYTHVATGYKMIGNALPVLLAKQIASRKKNK